MKTLITISNFIVLFLLIASPFVILRAIKKRKIKYGFVVYIISVFLISAFLFAWWLNFSKQILLSLYGYDFNGMEENEYYKNVSLENLEDAKKVRESMMGIGWPLKAMFSYIYYFPYLILVYTFGNFSFKQKIKSQ